MNKIHTSSRRILGNLLPVLLLLPPVTGCAQEKLPPDWQVTGQVERTETAITAQTAATVAVPLPAGQDVIRLRGKCGPEQAGLKITLKAANGKPANGKPAALDISAQALTLNWGKQKNKEFPDASLLLRWPGGRGGLFVRPNLTIYDEARREELGRNWDTLPAASQHLFQLELRRAGPQAQVWLDGQFLGEMPVEGVFTECVVALSPGAALAEVRAEKAAPADRLPLPIASYTRPGAMAGAQIKLSPNVALPNGLISPGQADSPNIDIAGLGRIPAITIDHESYAWRRSAVDALTEARLFSVPLATYSHVLLLCAAEKDPAKVAAFTVRLTRYGKYRGDAMADTQVTLPVDGTADTPDTRRVGEVTYGPANARQAVPLWLVRVPLRSGKIHDLLYDDKAKNPLMGTYRYLEFELLDPLRDVEADAQFPPPMGVTERTYAPGAIPAYLWNAQRDPMTKAKSLPDDKSSAVHVFGAALEQSPAALEVRANTPNLVFYAADKPELRATVTVRQAGHYSLQWEFADVDGKTAVDGKRDVTLSAARPAETVAVPVAVGNGWYATRFVLRDEGGDVLVDYRSSFVFLPPDTRRAGFESPFGTWWFHWAHGGEPDLDKVGPLLQRAGLRHTQLPDSLPQSVTQKYGVTAWMVPWLRHPRGQTLAEKLAEHEEFIRKYQKLWPGVNTMMVWHESSPLGAPFPAELWNETPPPLDAKSEKAWQQQIEYLTGLAKMVREKFPGMKLQYGNSGNSLQHIGELLRRKFPREYIDSISSEDLGQVILPETGGLGAVQDSWFLRETARKLGYNDIPVSAAYEWIGRRAPSAGLKDQAEWYIRDALHALAYGFKAIPLGLVHDAGDGYFHSIWGASGLTRRYPDMEPRPSYAALATLTQVLDSAKFERDVPTDRLSLYMLEFRRGNEWIYALWTPRGRRAVTLRMSNGGSSRLIDLYGREKNLTGAALEITASTGPQYVVSSSRLANVTTGKPAFPDDIPPSSVFVVDAMNQAGHWTVEEPERYAQGGAAIPHLQTGDFELHEVNDAEMGACLELELKPKGELWDFTHEYVLLRLKTPPANSGPYRNAGIWVKGNGGWGNVQFMTRSAKGEFPASGLRYQDWAGQDAINFEGWNFLRYPLDHDYRWNGQGSLTGLLITMPRKTLHLTEMKPVPELKIRLKGIALF